MSSARDMRVVIHEIEVLGTYVRFHRLRTYVRRGLQPGCAMYGRRQRCKGKNLTFSRNDTGAAMYPAFECSRSGRWP